MYYSISIYATEFIMYLLLLCFVSVMLCTIIGFLGVILFLVFFASICIVLYLFRYSNACPVNLVIKEDILVWPSEGTITHIASGSLLRLTGSIIHIHSNWKDSYTHVSPICGKILKIIYTDQNSQHNGAIYLQLINKKYQIDMLIKSSSTLLSEVDIPIMYVKEGDYIYASQPLCLSMFGAKVKFIIDHQNQLNLSLLYVNQQTRTGELIV